MQTCEQARDEYLVTYGDGWDPEIFIVSVAIVIHILWTLSQHIGATGMSQFRGTLE